MRTAISRVRCPTANASAAYNPIVLSTSASPPNTTSIVRAARTPAKAKSSVRPSDCASAIGTSGSIAAMARRISGSMAAAAPDTRMCVRESCDQLLVRSCCQ